MNVIHVSASPQILRERERERESERVSNFNQQLRSRSRRDMHADDDQLRSAGSLPGHGALTVRREGGREGGRERELADGPEE